MSIMLYILKGHKDNTLFPAEFGETKMNDIINIPPERDSRQIVIERRKERSAILTKLVELKFGTVRGNKSRCAEHLSCDFGNLSAMMKGTKATPDYYYEVLNELPNYELPKLDKSLSDLMDGHTYEMYKRITFDIKWDHFYKEIVPIAENLALDISKPDDMNKLMRMCVLSQYFATFGEKIRADDDNKNPLA